MEPPRQRCLKNKNLHRSVIRLAVPLKKNLVNENPVQAEDLANHLRELIAVTHPGRNNPTKAVDTFPTVLEKYPQL